MRFKSSSLLVKNIGDLKYSHWAGFAQEFITGRVGHMEKQEMEVEWKLETENGNGKWKRKLETEI